MKTVYASASEIPEAFRGEYESRDGAFHLKIEGAPAGFIAVDAHNALKRSDAEKRETNIQLLKALGVDSIDAALARASAVAGIDPARLAKLKDVDPDEYATLKARFAKLKDKGMDDPDAADGKLQAMLDAALKPITEKLRASEEALVAERNRANETAIHQAVADRFVKAGGRAKATDFIVTRAKEVFRVEDGVVKARPEKLSEKGQPITIEEWVAAQAAEFDFAFEPSKGTGGSGGAVTGTGSRMETTHKGPFRTASGSEIKTDGISVLQ